MSKILVIDDEQELRDIIQKILEENNFEVFTAKDGKQGIELAEKIIPNLILCDISMPVMDGYKVIESVRKIESLKSVPFIFLTGKSDREDFRKGMNLSADDYLTKPFRKIEILDAVNARLARSQQIESSIMIGIKDIESDIFKFLEDRKILKAEELESLIGKLKNTIQQKQFQFQIQNLSFMNSHLLRAPIANILGCLELAKNEPQKYEEVIGNIGKSTQYLDSIIHEMNELLNKDNKNEYSIRTAKTIKPSVNNIFLVDDDDLQLMLSSHLFEKFFPDLKIFAFSEPKLALDQIIQEGVRPDKIFLDIFMPEINGWDFLDELKKNSIFIDVTILSSSIDDNDIKKAKQYDCVSSFLSKPITKEKIEKIIN